MLVTLKCLRKSDYVNEQCLWLNPLSFELIEHCSKIKQKRSYLYTKPTSL